MLARDYGLITPSFLDSLSPEEKILVDYEILGRMIDADVKAQERARKKSQDHRPLDDHVGMHGRLSPSEALQRQKERKEREGG